MHLRSFIFLSFLALFSTIRAQETDKEKRVSPPAMIKHTFPGGTLLQINYSQPLLKGRVIGKNVEPMKNKVWRAGANEATTFFVNKDVLVESKPLPAGRYSLFMLMGNDGMCTVIFNSVAEQWGAFKYDKKKDVLRVKVRPETYPYPVERLSYLVARSGRVSLVWGTMEIAFQVTPLAL